MGSILVVALVGRTVRRGIRMAGLGMADRLAGGVVGATEGAIAVALLMMLAITAVGRDHPALADTRALEAFEQAEKLAEGQLPQVAAPAR